jgi:hypothetical protein
MQMTVLLAALDEVLKRVDQEARSPIGQRATFTRELQELAAEFLRVHGVDLREALVDAERYRWLRDSHNQGANTPDGEGLLVVTDRPSKTPRYIGPVFNKTLDTAIDCALRAAEESHETPR